MNSVPPNLCKTIFALFICAASGAAGWLLSSLCGPPPSLLTVEQVLPLEYSVEGSSFSELDNAKATLRAECARFLTDLRSRLALASINTHVPAQSDPGARSLKSEALAEAIKEIEKQLVKFQNAEVEVRLFREKLFLLNAGGWYQEWLNFYLRVLYENPTHQVCGEFVHRALTLGQATGREIEVLKAFGHVARVPYDLPVKRTCAVSTLLLAPN